MGEADAEKRPARPALPDALRVPVNLLVTTAVLAVAVGLYALSVHRDRTVAQAVTETGLVATALLDSRAELLGDDPEGLLAQVVLDTELVRAASVQLGDGDVVTVGAPTAGIDPSAATTAVELGEPVVDELGDVARVTTAFARVEGEPVVLVAEVPLRPPGVGWSGLALAWAVLAAVIVAVSLLVERSRRDRVLTLEETVQALYAHDAQVTRQQQELLRSKTDFVRSISHELRTPLQVIKGIAALLARSGDQLTDRQREDAVDGLRLNADRLDTLLRDIIDVDRLTTRTVSVTRSPVVIADALEAVRASVDTSRHVLVGEVDGVVANATPGHVERILRCLVHNAVKYTPAGTTITVRAVRRADTVELVVDDEGPGIPVADRARVFEPLHRLDDDLVNPGIGLGLALVKRFAELHGGRTWVEEAPGGGASFHVTLPDEGEPVRVDPWELPAQVEAAGVGGGE